MEKRIAIIGGGPGGLTLARILSLHGHAPMVFESEEHAHARPQGGSLDLHGDGAQRALCESRLEAAFLAVARHEDQYDALYDREARLVFEHDEPGGGGRPEIDRTQLRDMLLESLPAGMVQWNRKIASIEACGPSRHHVLGMDGSLGEFDLVVGADGAFSKVRPLLTDVRPHYDGVTFVELSIDDLDLRHPALAELLPRGKFFAVGDGKGMIAQRSSGGHVRVYLAFGVAEGWPREGPVDFSSPARARQTLRAQFEGWSERLLAFIDQASDHIVPRPLFALPVGHRWEPRPGVTLLGDAAHLMSPFGGNGVNLAMIDATELALALVANADWGEAVRDYEERMFARAEEPARGAKQGLMSFLEPDALAHIAAHFEGPQAPITSSSSEGAASR